MGRKEPHAQLIERLGLQFNGRGSNDQISAVADMVSECCFSCPRSVSALDNRKYNPTL